MEGAFFGSIIFEAIGVFSRWLFLRVVTLVKGGNPVSFKQVWEGRKKKASLQENVEYGFSNILLGVIIVLGIIVILKLVGI